MSLLASHHSKRLPTRRTSVVFVSTRDHWRDLGVDEMAALYDDQLTAIVDALVPARTVVCRRRPSDPWFDVDSRQAKRQLRRLERAASAAAKHGDAIAAAAARSAWVAQRRVYRSLLKDKRESYLKSTIASELRSPRAL